MKSEPTNENAVSRRKFLAGTSGFLAALPAMARAQAPAESEGIVIDCHVHLVKRAFPTRGLEAHFAWHEYGGDLFVAEMKRAHVDKGLLKSYSPKDLQYVTLKSLPGGMNALDTSEEYMFAAAEKYPDQLLWMDVFNPKDDDMAVWKTKINHPLLKGLAFYPTNFYPSGHGLSHQFYIDILEMAVAARKKPVLITFEQTPPAERDVRLKEWVALVKRFGSNINWAVQHGAYWRRGPGMLERHAFVEAVRGLNAQFDNIWVETAGERDEYPYVDWQEKVHALADEVGFEKIMWASDWPYVDAQHKYFQLVDAVRRHADWLSKTEKRWYLGENAARFMTLADAKPLR
jgi:predicted TIM-barrel fold metal-dependent hydrolase